MSKSTLILFSSLCAVAWLASGGFALGSVESPGAVALAPSPALHPGAVARKMDKSSAEKAPARRTRAISSYYTDVRDAILAKFRPVERKDPVDFDEAAAMLKSKTTLEKIFDKNFESKMRGEYMGRVSPHEKVATDPIWRPRYWEQQRYENGRADLARWTTREVVEDQLKDFFNGADKNSAAMKVISTARELTGGAPDEKPAEKKLTPEQKIARAHRLDLPPPVQEEEKIPTKVKTKINVLRQNGSIVFTNPVAITSLNGNRDDISLNMDKSFKKISLHSAVGYAMKQECLNVNVNKKITDQVSLDLGHYNYTGGKRGASGEKTREQARVNYSISF